MTENSVKWKNVYPNNSWVSMKVSDANRNSVDYFNLVCFAF